MNLGRMMSVYLAEFIGTAILVFLGNGVVANVSLTKSKGLNGGWVVITIAWGLAVSIAAYSVGRISGAHLNPAVSLALAIMGDFSWSELPGFMVSQVAGGVLGALLVWITYFAHWEVTEDAGVKLACFSNSPAIRRFGPAFITEVMGTAMLVFGILAIGKIGAEVPAAERTALGPDVAASLTGVVATWWSPLLVGLLVVSVGMSLGGPTGYAINPARDLGPRLAHQILPIAGKGTSDWSYAWVPVLGPLFGGGVGAVLFKSLFTP